MQKIGIGFEASLYLDNTTNVFIRNIKCEECLIGIIVKARGSMYFESKELGIGKMQLYTDNLTRAKNAVNDLLKKEFKVDHNKYEKIIRIYKGEMSHGKANTRVQKDSKEWHDMPAC